MIHARNIQKEFDSFVALKGVDFDIDKNGIFGIIGHNGAGKTTLLKICAGLLTPTSGTLEIDGINVIADPNALKERLGYLPEESRLYDTMTISSYLSFFGEIYGMPRREIKLRSEELLSSLNLDDEGKKLGELSKGMRRKVAIARSLLHDPTILVYDEATSGLDPMSSRFITGYFRKLRDEGKMIIISAHNLFQVEEISDIVMILSEGEKVAFGTMDELREQFGSLTYYIHFRIREPESLGEHLLFSQDDGGFVSTAKDIDQLNRITSQIDAAGGNVERIESRYPTLEEMLMAV
ncbi:ABC transporter ATP-binding protein [Methanocalculus taiwanensis]|uniref:ABC transporter ATP-binding protein n=2 Tax=Methanocalculus taiwanensis TaxID=106207 RepID=A0ABD4TJU0_9EURY|nr:ABC transporter ATP-binding protein [Methanocalculus taiwanensis]MCQ1538208.1 ABC transporter ATP-binding protein [Methanocalculus taiwanensis]